MLLWIATLLSFSSLSIMLVRAEKRLEALLTRIEILETCQRLQDNSINNLIGDLESIQKDISVLLGTESLSSTVDELLTKIEAAIGDLNAGESLTDRLDYRENREAELERDKLDSCDLSQEVKALKLTLSVDER